LLNFGEKKKFYFLTRNKKMSYFQSYSYNSSIINGKQNELFLHQEKKNNQQTKKEFVAKKSDNGRVLSTLRGKTQNQEKWKIQKDDIKTIIEKPYQHFITWFPESRQKSLIEYPVLQKQSPFDH
jgi:hypothetical protein